MTYEKARELAKQLQESEEFQAFQAAREVAFADETARSFRNSSKGCMKYYNTAKT